MTPVVMLNKLPKVKGQDKHVMSIRAKSIRATWRWAPAGIVARVRARVGGRLRELPSHQ